MDLLPALDHEIRNREQAVKILRDWYEILERDPNNEMIRKMAESFLDLVSNFGGQVL